jgi:putative flavoprotein involved in K+ transport
MHSKAHVRINSDGKCFTLLTTSQELRGHEEAKASLRPKGVTHGAFTERQSWSQNRVTTRKTELEDPYVVLGILTLTDMFCLIA